MRDSVTVITINSPLHIFSCWLINLASNSAPNTKATAELATGLLKYYYVLLTSMNPGKA